MYKLLILAVQAPGLASCVSTKVHKQRMQEYQIRLEPNTFYLYDKKRLVGYGSYGKDGIDAFY